MKKMLVKNKVKSELYYYEGGKRKVGVHYRITGITSGIWGNATNLNGDLSRISGDVSHIWGDVSGINGDVSGLHGDVSYIFGYTTGVIGDISDCKITDYERKKGIHINQLIKKDKKEAKK